MSKAFWIKNPELLKERQTCIQWKKERKVLRNCEKAYIKHSQWQMTNQKKKKNHGSYHMVYTPNQHRTPINQWRKDQQHNWKTGKKN